MAPDKSWTLAWRRLQPRAPWHAGLPSEASGSCPEDEAPAPPPTIGPWGMRSNTRGPTLQADPGVFSHTPSTHRRLWVRAAARLPEQGDVSTAGAPARHTHG